MKCSRFISTYQNDIKVLATEAKINIGNSKLNINGKEDKESNDQLSQESWSRKPKKYISRFSGNYWKQLDKVKKIQVWKIE